jgi:hypothetical protein
MEHSMQKDLHMTDVQWSAGISMFYVGKHTLLRETLLDRAEQTAPPQSGYIATQVPGALVLSKYKPRIVMPAMM